MTRALHAAIRAASNPASTANASRISTSFSRNGKMQLKFLFSPSFILARALPSPKKNQQQQPNATTTVAATKKKKIQFLIFVFVVKNQIMGICAICFRCRGTSPQMCISFDGSFFLAPIRRSASTRPTAGCVCLREC